MAMSKISTLLREDLKKFKSAPYLFVGSGFSKRHIGLEKWDELLMKFCEFDKMSSFEYYNSKANSVLEDVASLMAHDFHEVWWKDERFKESRNKWCYNYKLG